jgi:hypothetical protein
LQTSLSYLYTNPSGDRFWYDTRPTLRKTVEDRATQVSSPDVEFEIETRLRRLRKEQPFSGLHVCPGSSLDIPDEQSVRLVILRPSDEYRATNKGNSALAAVNDILNNRGNTPRIYRNMLAFIAPDQDMMSSLKQEVKRYIAWKSIQADSVDLNLDAAQNRETDNNLTRSNKTVDDRIKEAYCWLLVPYIDRNVDIKTIIWDTIKISGGTESIIEKAAKKMLQNESVITQWAPALLKMELDNLLWKDSEHIEIKSLLEYLCTYCYLPRLSNAEVLESTIRNGINSSEYFAFASSYDGARYVDLKFNQHIGIVERSGYLVKVGVAGKQLAEEAAKRQAEEAVRGGNNVTNYANIGNDANPLNPSQPTNTGAAIQFVREDPPTQGTPKNKHFFMSAQLDNTRIGRDVQKLVEEVISHLTVVDGASVEVSLEVNVIAPDGLSQQVVRTVSENCRTLRVQSFGFDE